MKKAIYSAVSLVIFWVSFCMVAIAEQSQSSVPPLFNQMRIGFGLAGEYINGGAYLKIEPIGLGGLSGIQSNQSQVGRRLQLAPCIELGITIAKDYYLGLHVSWRSSGVTNKSRAPMKSSFSFLHEFKINQYTDILIKSGYKINPCSMIYGLVGASLAKWSHITGEFNRDQQLVDQFKIDRKSVGLSVGLGFEYLFRKKYAFSFDYTHHFYRPISKVQPMSYVETGVFPAELRSGNVLKVVQPSFGVFAIRFTKFFSL